MSFRKSIEALQPLVSTPAGNEGGARSAVEAAAQASYRQLLADLHRQLLDRIDLEVMASLPPERLREELRILVERMIQETGVALNATERKRIVQDVQNEVMGFGPLEPLLADPAVSDILINGHDRIWVERGGQLELTEQRFASDAHLIKIIDKIVSRVGRRVDESSPMVDARLPDGSRFNAIIPPLSLDGPLVSIRRFSTVPLRMDDLVTKGSIAEPIAHLLGAMVRTRLNVLISGGTGSGKTTLLNILSSHIPERERVITIEDAAELQLQQPHVVRLETRPPNIEGKGEVAQRELVRNALRMRPDRIILGEVRGGEAFDMLQAMNTGHEGSMATVHANTPRDALARVENMIGMSGASMPAKAMRQQVASAIDAVVQVARLSDGRRRVMSVTEVTGMEGETITMQEIFRFEQTGVGAEGAVQGRFRATGIRPKFAERLRTHGAAVPDDLFDPHRAIG